MDKESPAQNNNETNETQYFNAPPVDKEVLKQRKEGEKQLKKQETIGQKAGRSPLLVIFIKEIIMVFLLVFIATRWKYEGDAGGNFGIAVGAGIIYLPFALVLNVLALDTSWQIGSTISLIVLSILFNLAIFCTMPFIMQIISQFL